MNKKYIQFRKIKTMSLLGHGFYSLILMACLYSLYAQNDLFFGRKPLENLVKTARELGRPSFIKIWSGNENLEYKNDDGIILRVENEKILE